MAPRTRKPRDMSASPFKPRRPVAGTSGRSAASTRTLSRVESDWNVGYWVRTGCTRQGIATATVRLVARLAFEDLDLERLEFVIGVDNVASRRVAEKAGAILHRPAAAGPAYLVNLRTMLPNFSAAPYAAHVCAPEAE